MPAEKIAEVAAKSPARAHGERVLSRVVSVDEKTLHGEPCFRDTRVPVKHLFDHLRAGGTLETFLTSR